MVLLRRPGRVPGAFVDLWDFLLTFGKIDENRKKVYRGAGLGLAISKNLIELMGGEIWVTSEEGRGTTFSLRLPVIES